MNFTISNGDKIGIIGPNGSGKSTLIKLLMGTIDPSQGKIFYSLEEKKIPVSEVYQYFSFSAPYMGVPDNFTMKEVLDFHFRFRKLIDGVQMIDIFSISNLQKHQRKMIRQFSSGMKQRFKLTLAILTDSQYIVLDEPTTNLDEEGKKWFHELIKTHLGHRTLIIATNEKDDLIFCEKTIDILDFKK
jgi:ABC-type multidrug transport system ATPase subunit